MKKFDRNHYIALFKALNEDRNPLIKEALSILNKQTQLSDVEFAASLQGLEPTYAPSLWINNKNEVFKWTDKGFEPRNWSPDYANSIRIEKDVKEEGSKEEN